MAKRDITIETEDGRAAAGLFTPERGPGAAKAGVILYMDIFGPRAALDGMAERLAAERYLVLVPDLFYRFAPYGPFDPATAFSNEETKQALMAMMSDTTQAMNRKDTEAFMGALADNGATGPIGTVGYCMGGGRALAVAGAFPDRIAAAASFHGSRLAIDGEDSPHRLAASAKGVLYVGLAEVDGSCPPEQSAELHKTLREAGIDHTIETYKGAKHGWAVPDHSVYDEAAAERHWKRLTTLFSETLQ